jgi:hypothetical protein
LVQGEQGVAGAPQGPLGGAREQGVPGGDAPQGTPDAGGAGAPGKGRMSPTVIEALHALTASLHMVVASLASMRFARWYRVCAIVVAVPGAIVLALVVLDVIPIHDAAGSNAKGLKPYEYVYLDSARVQAYLGQLDEGEVGRETRTDTSKDTAGGKLEIKSLGEASGSVTNEKTSSAVVSFSEADNFYKLEKTLRADSELTTVPLSGCCTGVVHDAVRREVARQTRGQALSAHARRMREREAVEARYQAQLEALPLGTMVKLENALLRVPPYLAAYPSLRYAVPRYNSANQVFEAAPLSTFSAAEVEIERSANRERAKFIEQAGANPRLPLSTSVHHLTIVIPARYAYLTGDPSLLNTSLTVVGKLVQRGEDFGDGASEATYLPALLHASSRFLHDIGVKESLLSRFDGNRKGLNRELFKALQRSLTFTGKSIEVIPIAVYD